MRGAIATAAVLACTLPPQIGHTFCGFYVSGSGGKMFNDATQVVLMRSGTRTVLAMQNDYRGPLEDFAMVVPVPVVLKEGDVKVLPKSVFDHVDSLGSPRLVEYWEQDPCPPPPPEVEEPMMRMSRSYSLAPSAMGAGDSAGLAGGGYKMDVAKDEEPQRMAIAPVLSSFDANPTTITANTATPVMFSYHYSNQPYPEPTCTIDHGVGNISNGQQASLTLDKTSDVTITCANSAGRSSMKVKINVVKVEAKFDVAEYQIVILSATEAAGLEEWLKLNHYKIPDGAEPLLRPYVESGSKFFVAKVDPQKVQMIDGHAALSPLRFHYDTDEFALPIRLGMANSAGKQDLIVNILSEDKRYEVANYKNVFIPTNFDVKASVKQRFGEFYAALFDATIAANPRSIVTEYAWTAQQGYHCDPCPELDVTTSDMQQLGADVVGGNIANHFVLTRLHARYGKNDMKDDLRFREAKPVTGGRENWSRKGLEYGATPSDENYFQARYAIRYWWSGPITCKHPQRGVWGGPPDGGPTQTIAASKVAFAPRGKMQLASVIKRDLWEIGYKKAAPPPPAQKKTSGTKVQFFGLGALGALMLLGGGSMLARRRRGA